MNQKAQKSRPRNSVKSVRSDYAINHQNIEAFILQYLKQHTRLPTQQQIAKEVKLNRDTVQAHLKTLNIQTLMPQYKNLSPRVMIGLFGKAASGNPLAAKLWLQVVDGFAEKHEVKTSEDDGIGMEDVPDDLISEFDEMLARRNSLPLSNSSNDGEE